MSVIVMKVPKQHQQQHHHHQQQQQDSISINSAAAAAVMTSRNRTNRCRSFHFRYLELCRSKNTAPIAEIRKNNKDQVTLDFFGDKLSYTDWQLITDAINCDQMLHVMSIRLRKTQGSVVNNIDAEKKAKVFRQKPVIYTKLVFANIIEAISNCIESNQNLRVLHLEGLPLGDGYVETIVKSLSTNKTIKDVSFARSNIYDAGCQAICNTFKYMENIEKLNLSDTGLTSKGAEYVANMIKIQKISRYTEGWQQSLRYNEIDMSNIAGLRTILLARNPQIGDEGLDMITEVLKEDVWVKVIDMENCGLTDRAANLLIECLSVNNYISEFNISNNPGISKFLIRKIGLLLRKGEVDTDARTGEELLRDFSEGRVNSAELAKKSKLSMQQLIDQLKKTNEQLQLERRLRLKAEQLNEKLTAQVKAYESKLTTMTEQNIPEGFVVVKNASLQSIIRERNDFEKLAAELQGERITFVDEQNEEDEASPRTLIKNLNYLIQQGENGVQFLTPLPEPNAETPATISARSNGTQEIQSLHRQPSNIRKVKSEMKYIEPPTREQAMKKKKDTKSDYDYATESDVPRFESNIGDTVANMIGGIQQQQHQHQQQIIASNNNNHSHNNSSNNSINNNNNNSNHHQHQHQHHQASLVNARRSVRYASNVQIIKKYELDEMSLPSSRSHNSVASSTESDTLRCTEGMDCHIAADFKNIMQHNNNNNNNHTTPNTEHGQGEGGAAGVGVGGAAAAAASATTKRSPRSLFLGLCEQ